MSERMDRKQVFPNFSREGCTVEDEAVPCMHCGENPNVYCDGPDEWWVDCCDRSCDCCGPYRATRTRAEAVQVWNRQNRKYGSVYAEQLKAEIAGLVREVVLLKDENAALTEHRRVAAEILAEAREKIDVLEERNADLLELLGNPDPDFTAYVVKSCGIPLATPNAFMHGANDCPMLLGSGDRAEAMAGAYTGSVVRKVEIRYVEEVE